MLHLRTSFFLFLFFQRIFVIAQTVSAFTDNKNCFFVFDNGISKQLEYLPVESCEVGGNYLAYIDNAGNFKP